MVVNRSNEQISSPNVNTCFDAFVNEDTGIGEKIFSFPSIEKKENYRDTG